MAQRRTTCKEAKNQDLTDHRTLREQLHTIRTASFKERHGTKTHWKAEKNATKMENHSIQLYTATDILKKESGQTVTGTTNPNIQNIFKTKTWCWFLDLGSKRSSSNHTWCCEQNWVRVSIVIYFLRILQCTSVSYIETHHQDLNVRRQTAKKEHEIADSRSQTAMGSKTKIPKLMKFITKHPWVQVLRKEERNRTIWSLHVEIIQIWVHIL